MPNGSGNSKNSPDPKSGIPYATLTTPISSTPSNIPNPTLDSLAHFVRNISGYNILAYENRYVPLPLGPTNDYSLSVDLAGWDSLNAPPEGPQKNFRWVLAVTRLHYAASISALRTVPLGRILYREQKTFWIVVMEIQHGNLYALCSKAIEDYELDWASSCDENTPEDDDGEGREKEAVVALPEFDDRSWKAVWIGNTSILEEKNFVGRVANAGYRALMIERWDTVWLDS